MKKKFVRLISAVLSAAMTLTAVPLSAFAEGEGHTHDGEGNVITTPLDFREKTADENGAGWSWDHDTKTLTLNGVNIQATTEENMMSVVTVPDGTKIVLNGENTIVQTDTLESDTYVLSAVNNKEVNCDGTMTISGDGVLNAENRSTDSMARSLGGSIILNGGTVNATGTVKTNSLEIHNDGVLNANATTASFEGVAVNVSGGITVDGNGSLTAVGCANESTLNSAILLTSNFGDKISVSENGSITVPEGNAARVGIYYSGNNGDGMDAEISGGKVTAYGAKYGIYKVNLIMSGTGSVYTTGGSYAIGQTVPTIDEDEFVVKGSTESKASESAVTGEVKLNGGYYEIDGADAKTVVIKPDTSPRIILGKQTGIFKTEEYEIIEGMDMTDTKLKGTVYFDITLKNMSDEEFADARGYFGGDEPDLSASIIKTDYGWVCMVCDTEFSTTYDTDNTLTIKCGDIVSNTVQVKSNANRFNKVTQGDNTNRTVFYTNTSQEEKDNYKLVSTYTVDSESISYNWYSTNSAYSADELGAAVSGSNGEFKLADNIPAGNYVLYCDITYSDGDSTETVTEKFTFTYKECAHENGYSDGKCTNCGALCDHSDIDIGMGKCNKCERQFVATISTDGNAPTGYDTLADCLDSITADTGNYVKIYQDIGDTSATATLDTIDVKHNVMVDLNGHKLNNIKLGVNKDVTLTLTGTAGSYVTQVYVRKGGGSFIIDSEANVEFNTIFVEDSARLAVNDGAKVTTEQLTVIASVNDDGTTTTSVKLATGMKLGGLTYHCQNNSGALKLGNLLDVTRQALRREDNGNYLDLYKEYGSMGYSVALTVVEHTDADHKYGSGTGKCEECGKPCEHGGDINTDTGICSICGAVVSVALYTDKNGNLQYVDTDELHSLLNEYNGSGTIKLFKDYSKPSAQYDLYGELTIDLNGRRLNIRSITPCKNGKLTIKNSGNPVMLGCNVYPTNDASYAGGTLIIDGDVVLDTSIYVYDSSTVILKAGAYPAGLYARDSKTLYDMLGEGKAFFKTDGTLFNANVKEISSSETLTVKDHSHTYVDGKCGCGYVCTHSDVDIDTGKCTECEYQYAAVIVKDGAVASVYKETEMEAAFEAADSDANTGCILKVYKNYTGSYTTLSGKFTLWIAEKANVGTLTVSGDITVTGSGKNKRIYGDFNVAASGKLTFDENCGAMGTVSVGAGTFDCYSTFSITLNINDASSDVILHGGAFKTICYNGGGDRANAEILTLLAENRMFMKSPNPEPIDGSKTLLKDGFATTVIVIPHEGHSYDSTTGKCTICGKRCGHTDVDSKTGVCSTCKYQLTAGISGAGTAKYFDNIDDAFTAALSAENNGCTLTLYKHCEITQSVEIGQATVTVDVNGYSLGGEADISVNNGGVLYLKDSRKSTYYGCIDAPFSVNGGTLINGTADGGSSAADVLNLVINSAKCVEIYGGIFENVYIAHASGVALYGGRYNTICGEESNRTPVNDLLAKGYAFATVQEFTTLPESIVDGSAKTIGGRLTNVTVVAHTHTYNETNTKCACGAVLYAKVTSADGTTNEYFDSIEEGLLYADKAENKGCVFTLVTSGKIKDYVTLSNGQFTITAMNNNCVISASGGKICIEGADVIAEGHMLINCSIDMISGSLTLPEGSGTRFGTIIISGGTVNISEGVNADNNAGADKLFIANATTDAKVTIGGGTYGNVVFEPFKLKDVLASGVRVIRYDNPSDPTAEKIVTALLYSDIAEESYLAPGDDDGRYYLVTKCEHKNEDGSYAFNEGGICKYCNSEFAASVSYTDGGEKTELFSNICDAFDKANEAGTATITLCRDIADSEIAHEINVTGNVTLALNGKTLGATDKAKKIYICGSTLTVNGNGKVWSAIEAKPDSKLTITNGEYYDVYALSDSEVVILDGIIDCLSVYGTGKAEVSGGKFKYLFMYNGKAIESVLADGYAYKNADGTWLSIDEREKDSYLGGSKGALSVEEAPIKSATISAENESPIIYRNGKKASTFAADVTYSGNETLYITGCLIDGTVISEKTELLNGYCYLLGDQVDKAVAEDGEIQYYCIFTYDGYDYKSNVVTLTVATCQHPGESVKCDDNGCVCGICNRALTASVELSDGTLSYYENWNDAIGAAEESEGCTLKLLDYSGVNDGEIFDISKGRFTVDLNKNDGTTTFAFDVKGGDITFTASQAASSSLTGVTVSGENANVLIDSKATLNYLVVNSGKVSADGANIGAITINGGDTVINDVNADYLSMKADTTGGSGYNVSIVSGTFNIFTCENESNYTLGRAIASGSRVIGLNAIVGSGFKYAEIQSMTKANYLNVIKCDHKDENDSYALDGNLCPYCNEEIAATVSYTADGGEQTDLFSDIYDAFAKANEAGTATVTLYKDITNSELTQGVTITGNVTLALNGKKLGGTFAFNAPVEVSDGGMFTVGGDGKMRMPIKAYANSKLIINGGEFTSVMVYIDGDAEIGGGVIDALTIIGNAKAKISGGKFYNIEIANGSLESVLADGYAYKKDGGAWLSIAERAESVYSSVNNDNKPVNVEEAPIKSATLSTEINKLYRNSNANPTLKFNLALAHGSNLNDSYVSKRYGINSYVSGDIIYSSLSALVKDAKLSADEIIDKAGNSVAAKIYFVVITDDGYEIKSNTVSIDLVDCDHSQVVDPTADKETAGNITEPTYCEICESKFNAKITKGDDVKYYNDLDEAAKDAQKSENEGCTLYPLYNKNGYGGQLVITEGNFTLKYAVRTAFSRPIIINGKAKLTVTGRCAVTAFENQDAFIVRGGDVTFDGLATGSNVTINGGNVTMTANNINCLTINGGNVSISSGGFAEIVTTVSDKVIADYIDPGFWVQDRGTKEWIDIYSLNKATASSTNGLTVRLCPMQIIKPIDTVYYTNGYYPGDIPSLQINAEPWYSGEVDANVAYQWIAIDENGNETEIEGATDRKLSLENLTTGRYYCRLTYSNATTAGVSMKSDVVTATITECEHSGGEATCTKKAKCEICGAEYGEPLGHDYVVIKVVEPDYRNEGYSVFECTRCKDSYIGNRVPVKPIPDVEEIAVEKTTYNEVDISWKNISGVDGYYVECYVGNQWKQIGFSTDGDRVAAKLSGLSAGLKYKVRIAAYAGRFTGKFRCFYVDTVPSPVWNINTVKATDETVRISWSRNTRADGYKVEWYIDNQWSVKTVTGNNNIAAVIDGLCAGTRYKVRVSAYKGDLYSPYTYGYIDTLPSKVTGITQTVTSSSFTLKWDKNESADGYTVQYYADGKWNEKTLTGNSKTTVTIGSLKGYKTYKVRIKAYKGELQSTFDDIYITTAPTKVSGLKVKSAVDSKAVVIWNADATADGYNVEYYIGGKWVEKTITDNKTAMAVLGGLTPYSTYKVRVRAYKDNLYGDYSYTTVTAVLSPVTDVKVVSAKSNSITVKWGKNASADGYKVEIYKGGKWVKKTLKGSTNATVTIDGLRAGSVYKVRIASYKGANTSTFTYANVNTAK
ncbi:MAG: fibronectin type III domain-containing protein [[Eubacterium] siraeum]|nr:fibronectin type III domain-containing protein [[Eubacterium] siraeum]